jgi:Protein of unknown function (DUF3572)
VRSNVKQTPDEPAVIALNFLAYLANDQDLLGRFMGLTGFSPDDLRAGADNPTFQAGLLDFLLEDESLLLAFAANADLPPASIMRARAKLPGFSP